MRALGHIASCVLRPRRSFEVVNVVFDEDSTSVGHGLEMSPSGSSETPSLVLVDEFPNQLLPMLVKSKSPRMKTRWMTKVEMEARPLHQHHHQLQAGMRRTIGALKSLDIREENGDHLESGGRTTSCRNKK